MNARATYEPRPPTPITPTWIRSLAPSTRPALVFAPRAANDDLARPREIPAAPAVFRRSLRLRELDMGTSPARKWPANLAIEYNYSITMTSGPAPEVTIRLAGFP